MAIKERIAVLPDIHVPNHNQPAINAVFNYLKDYKPTTLIQLGDFCDWDSVSSYDVRRESDIVLIEHEVRESNRLLDTIDALVPRSCKKVMIGGNHEARYEKFKINYGFTVAIRRMKDFGSWHQEYNLAKRGWKHTEYGGIHEHGKILFTHGWYTGGQHAKRHLGLYHKCIIYGHTHEFQVAVENGFDGHPIMSASIGTLSNFNLSYLVGKPPVNWINMFATIDVMADGTFTPSFIPIINGRFVKDGKQYGV